MNLAAGSRQSLIRGDSADGGAITINDSDYVICKVALTREIDNLPAAISSEDLATADGAFGRAPLFADAAVDVVGLSSS
jgi:hypothetical protein